MRRGHRRFVKSKLMHQLPALSCLGTGFLVSKASETSKSKGNGI